MLPSLSQITAELSALAPLACAEAWDNVGLLLEPASWVSGERKVQRVLLTIDLNQAVLDEACARQIHLIVAYHPPIFSGVKRLTFADPGQRLLLQALAAEIAIYSPHTALDAAAQGINDWLAEGAGPGKTSALLPGVVRERSSKLVVYVPEANAEQLREALCRYPGVAQIGEYSNCTFGSLGEGTFQGSEASHPRLGARGSLTRVREVRLEMLVAKSALGALPELLQTHHPYEEPAWELQRLDPVVSEAVGMGRSIRLAAPAPLNELVQRYKEHLGLRNLRVATAPVHESGEAISSVNVCAGAGSSVFEKAPRADLYVTGELRHHDILGFVAHGASVILTDHSNSERGYLPSYRRRILERCPDLLVELATADSEPLRVM